MSDGREERKQQEQRRIQQQQERLQNSCKYAEDRLPSDPFQPERRDS